MLKEKLTSDMKEAMKAKDADKLGVLRMLLAAIKNEEIQNRAKTGSEELSDEEVVKILRRENKRREESVKIYTDGLRPELAEAERKEIEVIGRYLPPELGEPQVRELVVKAIALGAKDIKGVMEFVRQAGGSSAPGKLTSDIAKELLG